MHKRQDIISEPPLGLTMVCGRKITAYPTFFPQAIFKDDTIYFCTESCLNAFRANPEHFNYAHT